MRFNQCVIKKQVLNTIVEERVYLPEEYCEIGKIINIRIDGKWDYGWKVSAVNVLKDKIINGVIESKDINTEKEKTTVYRSIGGSGKRGHSYNPPYEPRDKDHQ